MAEIPMPIGIIDQPTETGATFTMTRPHERKELKPGTPVIVWDFHQDFDAMARVRGQITKVSNTTASFISLEYRIDPSWPDHIDPIGAGNGVYLAESGSFCPDTSRPPASPKEIEMLWEFAKQHGEMTGLKPHGAAFGFVRRRNTDYDHYH